VHLLNPDPALEAMWLSPILGVTRSSIIAGEHPQRPDEGQKATDNADSVRKVTADPNHTICDYLR
jgi:hypothetical protein